MTDNGIVIRYLLICLVISIFAGQLGMQVSGAIVEPSVSEEAPGLMQVVGWCWDGLVFLFNMIAFQVDGVPEWLSAVFLLGGILVVWVLLKFVRGGGST